MKFLAMPLRSERRYLPSLGVYNGNLPQNGWFRFFKKVSYLEASNAQLSSRYVTRDLS
eukprot:COSAG03_NODE_483_length_7559_cov_2.993432_7_plen_58_part_00